jgi:predicted kinase
MEFTLTGPLLIVVSGLPATGKTTLARHLAEELRLPLIARDALKESLFDTLGWSDREWSKKVGLAALRLLYHVTEAELRAGRSLIVESNFSPALDAERFRGFQRDYGAEIVQILCKAEGETLYRRFRERWESGGRHPGHVEHTQLEAIREALLRGRAEPLDIAAPLLEVDTSDFAAVDHMRIVAFVRGLL